jgi:hypothetical protein
VLREECVAVVGWILYGTYVNIRFGRNRLNGAESNKIFQLPDKTDLVCMYI